MPANVCCFSGHRNIPEEIKKEIIKKTADTVRTLCSKGIKVFKAGGALGFDTLAALCVLEVKKDFPDVRLELELIAKGQDNGWAPSERAIYRHVIEEADAVRYASPVYTRGAIFARNRNLVDGSGYCICYLTSAKGGTAYTVNYAAERGLKIINIANI